MSDKNKKGRKKDSVSSEPAGEKLNGYEDKKLTEGADNELNASETASETKGEKLAEALGSAAYDENPPKNDDSNRILMEESADKPDSSADENGSELSADESRKTKNEENKSEFLTKTEKDEDSAFSEKEKTEKSSELSEKAKKIVFRLIHLTTINPKTESFSARLTARRKTQRSGLLPQAATGKNLPHGLPTTEKTKKRSGLLREAEAGKKRKLLSTRICPWAGKVAEFALESHANR